MGAICLIDTSIFLEVLNVPQKANQHKFIMELLKEKINEGETLFLPMATILETGNHIAQNLNSAQRLTASKVGSLSSQTCISSEITSVLNALRHLR